MNSPADESSLGRRLRHDEACVRFEKELRAGGSLKIETLLKNEGDPGRAELLEQLLFIECEHQIENGKQPKRGQLIERFPNHSSVVDRVLTKLSSPEVEVTQTRGDSDDSTPSGSSLHGRFDPGQRVAGRYRIVSLLGKGGMGEVYRADDLVLGQPVALKFLPEDFANDSKRLEYFFSEVRLARQVTHANVCRVHDIGEVNGQHFISMEFIDGEDLKTLLSRIGRLPEDKGIEIARQLCEGLAAAHEKGVLHRDMKPANVMLDGHGQVRITDFGLATLDQKDRDGQSFVGTPAYMSPEQLAHGKTSVQSDIYSLGLVLHEVFTGQRPNFDDDHGANFKPANPEDPQAASLRHDTIEPTIRTCLQIDPTLRPATVKDVARRLPGGDPLVAALAAGRLPTPQVVAEAGEKVTLTPRTALCWLAGLVAMLALAVVAQQYRCLLHQVPEIKGPEVLRERSQQVLATIDPDREKPADYAYGYDRQWIQEETIKFVGDRGFSESTPAVGFWYRESPTEMFASDFGGRIEERRTARGTKEFPDFDEPGMALVRLGPTGRLLEFRSVPKVAFADNSDEAIDWAARFPKDQVGFDWPTLRPSNKRVFVPVGGTPQFWEGELPNTGELVYVVTAVHGGEPTHFQVFRAADEGQIPRIIVDRPKLFVLILVINLVTVFLAIRNLRLGRGDGMGARRLAVVTFILLMTGGMLNASHVTTSMERGVYILNLAYSAGITAEIWLLYIALEPLVRRTLPELLISWSRLLNGRFCDSRLGRDALIGLTIGCFRTVLEFWRPGLPPLAFEPLTILSVPTWFGHVVHVGYMDIWSGLAVIIIYAVPIFMFRHRLAGAAAILFTATVPFVPSGAPPTAWAMATIGAMSFLLVVARYGLVAILCDGLVLTLLKCTPLTLDSTKFFYDTSMLTVLLIVGLASAAAYTATGGRMFSASAD